MSDIIQPPDGLFFPNAKPSQPKKSPPNADSPNADSPKEHPSIPTIAQSTTCPQNNHPVLKAVPKLRPLQDIKNVRDIIKFRRHLLKLVQMIGFSDYFFQQMPWRERTKQPFGSLPKELVAIYLQEKHFDHDLALQHVQSTASPVFMSSIGEFIREARYKSDAFHGYADHINACQKFGYNDFYYIPLRARGVRHILDGSCRVTMAVSVKGMSSDDFKRKVEKHAMELDLLAQAIFCKGDMEFPAYFMNVKVKAKVNGSRPMQLLNALAKEDMNLKQAADKLCISIDTANKHIASAKKAWGTRTQAAAVYRAIKAGLIT